MALIDRILERIVKWRGFVLVREDMFDRMLERIRLREPTVRISWSEPPIGTGTAFLSGIDTVLRDEHGHPVQCRNDRSKSEPAPDGYRAWHGRWIYGWSDPSAR